MSLYEIAEPHTFVWLAESLAHVLWQGTLFAGLAAMVAQGLHNRSAQARYMLHCSALFMISACLPLNLWVFAPLDPAPVFPMPRNQTVDAKPFVAGIPETNQDHGDTTVDWHAPLAAGPADSKTSAAADGPLGAVPTSGSVWMSASKWIVAVYLLGMIAMSFRLMMGVYGGHRLRATATPVEDTRVQDILAHVADQVRLNAVPIVAYSARVTTPLVVGVVKPAILLPVAIMSNLTTGQVESLLLHELAHIRRYDHVVNLFQRIVEALLFFHPAVWWLSHKISVEREHCCDDQAIAWGSEPCDYAESLIRVSELRFRAAGLGASGAATLAAKGEKSTRLHDRVLHVLGMPLPGPNPGLTRLGVAVMLALAVSTAAIVATRAGDSDDALRSGTVEISVSDREGPQNEADGLLRTDDVTTTGAGEIVWDEERRGWQVGAKLISTTNRLQPGDPVVVQLLLRNATKEPQTVVLQQYDATHPTLGADGRISMNISGSSENRHQHVIAPGAILEKPQYRVVLSTQGMLPGEYHIDPQPAFWQPDKGDPNSATGIGRKTPIHFMLGDPSAVTYSQPPVEEDPALRIHWGNHVSGLIVGMRLPQGRVLWKNNSRIEAEMFVCNVSDRTITFDYEVPPPGEWNSHIKTSDGKDVQLDFTWTTGFRQ
ncbi:MAG: M56 family metallopeptidase, partial [Pirellulales bacterium]|nr:M56 family metallopeptidase [Pirellulales bacterium]